MLERIAVVCFEQEASLINFHERNLVELARAWFINLFNKLQLIIPRQTSLSVETKHTWVQAILRLLVNDYNAVFQEQGRYLYTACVL